MRKDRKVKCPVCEIFNDKENTVYHNNRYYCTVCFENQQKEAQYYKDLCKYICDLYEISAPTGWMLKQIKDFKDQYNYTYAGMKSTLKYFYELKQKSTPDGDAGLGIIPYVYDEARKFAIEKKLIKDSVDGLNVDEIIQKTKQINVKRTEIMQKDKYDNVSIINISDMKELED